MLAPTVEARIVVCGPIVAPSPIFVSPRRAVPGSIVVSWPISTPASIQVEAGSVMVDAGEHVRLVDPAARLGLDEGEVGAGVHAEVHVGVGGDVGGDAVAVCAHEGKDVAQVVLAGLVVVR